MMGLTLPNKGTTLFWLELEELEEIWRTQMASLNTPYATLSFPTLFQPRTRAEGGEPVYSTVLIFNQAQQASPAYKAMVAAVQAKAKEEWGEKLNMKEVHSPFRDAGEKSSKWAGFEEGHVFISPWSKSRPGIVNAQRQDILLPEEVWAGQLVRANITPFTWVNSGRKGVSFALNHVQIIRTDTPRIDGRGNAASVFDDGEVDESGADLF
jgi:hypothetical protein